MRTRLTNALLWTVAFVAVAVCIAAGSRLVDWIMDGNTAGIWKAAFAILAAASGGGFAIATIRRNGHD